MKKILLIAILLPTMLLAQEEKAVTTQDEYNYLTTEYKTQLENGSDFLKGYEIKKVDELVLDDFTVKYSLLKDTATNQNKAMSIIISKKKDKKDKIVYLCMPFNNAELFSDFYKKKSGLGISMGMSLDFSIYAILAKALEKVSNRCK